MFVFGTADDVFAMAVRIEENGYAFYSGAAEKTDISDLKRLFEELAEMEKGHITAFKALRSDLAGSWGDQVWDPEGLAQGYLNAAADNHVFSAVAAEERLKGIDTPQDALAMAIQFEKDSVVFFVSLKEALPDESGKSEVEKLVQAELDHIRMLTEAQKTL